MTKDEVLKLALEALERCVATCFDPYAHEQAMSWSEHFVNQTITAIKEALAQPEQDGKCKYCTDGCPACDASKLPEQKSVAMADYMALTEKYVALKATQPEQEQFALKHRIAELEGALIGLQAQRTWVGLTDEEYTELWGMKPDLLTFFRKIEAKLKEKNT